MAQQNNKRNNKGFTLVELLIAMVILALVVVPLLNSFIVSARLNAKAKRTLSATSLAQNIMEGLKANRIDELVYQFNNPGDPNNKFNVIDQNSITGTVKQMTIDGTAVGDYYFSISGIQEDSQKYDALIHISPTAYQTDGNSSQKYNEQEISNISSPNTLEDAYYVHKDSIDANALESFRILFDIFLSQLKDSTGIYFDNTKLTRTIDVTMNRTTDPAGTGISSATVKYTYSFDDPNISNTFNDEQEIFNSSNVLRGVYLFYAPLYTSTATTNVRDVININNPANLPLTVYIVKQKLAGSNTYDNVNKENNYKMKLNVLENTSNPGESNLELRTNLDTNLYSGEDIIDNQAIYSYNGNTGVYNNILPVKGLVSAEKKNLIYDIEVVIYEAGAAEKDFTNTKELISIAGSMND